MEEIWEGSKKRAERVSWMVEITYGSNESPGQKQSGARSLAGGSSRPGSGINDVLIQITDGICGTDVHIYNWDEWAQKTIPVPMVIGHEFVGEVVEVGPTSQDFKPGDLVSGEGHVVCGRCRNCLAGRRHLCTTRKAWGSTARARSPSILPSR